MDAPPPTRLESDDLTVEVSLAHGCAITRIRHRDTGVDLLRHEPKQVPSGLGPTGSASRDYFQRLVFVGGWFPMFPVAGGPGGREDLRLHGEAPRVPWKAESVQPGAVTASVVLPGSRLEMRRRIEVRSATVATSTTAHNPGRAPIAVAAGEHPCFDLRTLGITTVRIGDDEIALDDDDHIEHMVRPAGGRVVLPAPRLERDIAITWDPAELPGLLLWRRGREILGVEPKTFVGRSWDEIGEKKILLQPGAEWGWSVNVDVSDVVG